MFSQVISRSSSLSQRTLVTSSREALRALPTTGSGKSNAALSESAQVTEVSSSLKVISLDTNSPLSTLSLYVKAGSRYETHETQGATHFLKHLAFKDTHTKSALRLIRDLEHIGATYHSQMSRETLSYHIKAVRPNEGDDLRFSVLLESLLSFLYPVAHEHELKAIRKGVQRESDAVESDPATTVLERVHLEAFGPTGLGRSLYAPSYIVDEVTPKEVKEHVKNNFQTAYVVATGVNHRSLVDKITTLNNKHNQSGTPVAQGTNATEKSQFLGNSINRVPGPGAPHVAYAFKGAAANSQELAALYILKALLGGASGANLAPGTANLSSVLTQAVEQNHLSLASAHSFVLPYSDIGLFGVLASFTKYGGEHEFGNYLRHLLSNVKVSDEDLHRARVSAIADFERRRDACPLNLVEEISQATLANQQWSRQAFYSQLHNVNAQHLQGLAQQLVQAPVAAAAGDLRGMPRI